jgi:hypothetical protein
LQSHSNLQHAEIIRIGFSEYVLLKSASNVELATAIHSKIAIFESPLFPSANIKHV